MTPTPETLRETIVSLVEAHAHGDRVDWDRLYPYADAWEASEQARQRAEYLRPEVVAFARLMEDRLRANEHKGGWKGCNTNWLMGRLREEAKELQAIFDQGMGGDVGHEAADVANFAMMVADKHGAIPRETP